MKKIPHVQKEVAQLKEISKIAAQERARLPEMVAGTLNEYTVGGLNLDNEFVVLDFVVKARWFGAKPNKAEQYILVIEERVPRGGTQMPVFVFHSWLTKKTNKIQLTRGKTGDVQFVMLQFLKKNLAKEIAEAQAVDTNINSMRAIDIAHAAELEVGEHTPIPVAGVDVSSMMEVDSEHKVLELME